MKTPVQNTIREQRTRLGLRQLDVACALGFNNVDRISRWEHGIAFPHIINLFKLARLFGVPAEELYPSGDKTPIAEVREPDVDVFMS